MYRLTSAFPSTAAAAVRARLVAEGAVEAFSNGHVGMDVGAAVCLKIVRRQDRYWHAVASSRTRHDLSAELRFVLPTTPYRDEWPGRSGWTSGGTPTRLNSDGF